MVQERRVQGLSDKTVAALASPFYDLGKQVQTAGDAKQIQEELTTHIERASFVLGYVTARYVGLDHETAILRGADMQDQWTKARKRHTYGDR